MVIIISWLLKRILNTENQVNFSNKLCFVFKFPAFDSIPKTKTKKQNRNYAYVCTIKWWWPIIIQYFIVRYFNNLYSSSQSICAHQHASFDEPQFWFWKKKKPFTKKNPNINFFSEYIRRQFSIKTNLLVKWINYKFHLHSMRILYAHVNCVLHTKKNE